MRVNVYAEEMTDRVEIVEKGGFTGLRIYLELPVTQYNDKNGTTEQIKGPFEHGFHVEDGKTIIDDDSSAVTFWGKEDLRNALVKALHELDKYYAKRNGFTDEEHATRS